MNWKLLSLLSLFGLGMGFATAYGLSTKAEQFVWLPVFAVCAWFIARNAEKRYFLHGFVLSLLQTVWVIIVHIKLQDKYLATHPKEAGQFVKMHAESGATVIQCIMITTGFAGILSGIVLGLFARMVSGFLKKIA